MLCFIDHFEKVIKCPISFLSFLLLFKNIDNTWAHFFIREDFENLIKFTNYFVYKNQKMY